MDHAHIEPRAVGVDLVADTVRDFDKLKGLIGHDRPLMDWECTRNSGGTTRAPRRATALRSPEGLLANSSSRDPDPDGHVGKTPRNSTSASKNGRKHSV